MAASRDPYAGMLPSLLLQEDVWTHSNEQSWSPGSLGRPPALRLSVVDGEYVPSC